MELNALQIHYEGGRKMEVIDYTDIKTELGLVTTKSIIKVENEEGELEQKEIEREPSTKDLRAFEVAKIQCELYAPNAPETIMKEAVVRLFGWLKDTNGASPLLASVAGIGSMQIRYNRKIDTDALRHSGAKDILSKYRMHNAGVV